MQGGDESVSAAVASAAAQAAAVMQSVGMVPVQQMGQPHGPGGFMQQQQQQQQQFPVAAGMQGMLPPARAGIPRDLDEISVGAMVGLVKVAGSSRTKKYAPIDLSNLPPTMPPAVELDVRLVKELMCAHAIHELPRGERGSRASVTS